MNHSESDVERQISIQGIYLTAFWNYIWKRENELVCPFGGFLQDKLPQFQENLFVMRHFTFCSFFNIMNHSESDVERHISIQGIYLTTFWNYIWKREGSFKS